MLASINKVVSALSSAFLMYVAVFLLLTAGVLSFGGGVYAGRLLIYAAALVMTFLALSRIKLRLRGFRAGVKLKYCYEVVVLATIAFVLLHWYFMGGVPLLRAFSSSDAMEIVLIRQRVTEHAGFAWNYGSALILRAVLPFFLFYGFAARKRLQPLLVVVAFCYSISLLQKSHVFMVFMPVIIFALLRKRFLPAVFLGGVAVAGVGVLLLATAPEYRPAAAGEVAVAKYQGHQLIVARYSALERVAALSKAVADRTLWVPGMVVKQWFDLIPAEIPFQEGCGYRFLAPALGCEHYNLPLEVYGKLYPEMTEKGVKGSVNVASFMEDYANWGRAGLLFSGILLGTLLWLLRSLFGKDWVGEAALNAIPILSLSSAALSTTLLSGGWLATLFLYYMFRDDFQAKEVESGRVADPLAFGRQ